MMCKDNYAAIVRQIVPHRHPQWCECAFISVTVASIGVLTDFIARHNNNYVLGALVTRFGVPAGRNRKRSKIDALAEDGTLNPAPEKVRDPKFQADGFFDPRDIVQVKYEIDRKSVV